MAQSTPLFVGLDVHKESIAVVHAGSGAAPPVFVGEIGSRQVDIDQLLRRLQGKAATLRVAYEAGPSGYGLYRYLTGQGRGVSGRGAVADPEETRRQGED